MFGTVLLFAVGIAILLFSTEYFIRFAQKVSISLRISPLIVGVTLVSIGTSLPEMVVSLIAVTRGDIGLAMGNIIGSNIVNVFLVLAIGILVGKLRVGTQKTQQNILMMLGVTGLFLISYVSGLPSSISGGLLVFSALMISVYLYILGVRERSKEDRLRNITKSTCKFNIVDFVNLLGTLIGIVVGGILTVRSVENLSSLLGISTTFLGLSATAVATSLPELMTTVFSQKNHEEKITIGNIIGSNIYNLALIGGLVLLLSSWEEIGFVEISMLILSTLAFSLVVVLNKGIVISKYYGLSLLGLFVIYVYVLNN